MQSTVDRLLGALLAGTHREPPADVLVREQIAANERGRLVLEERGKRLRSLAPVVDRGALAVADDAVVLYFHVHDLLHVARLPRDGEGLGKRERDRANPQLH